MNREPVQLQSNTLLAIVASVILFIISSTNSEGSMSVLSIIISGAVLIAAIFAARTLSTHKLKRIIGLGSVIFGITFWGIGWVMMVMLEATVGWWVFISGWTLLSLGLIIFGAADIQKRNLPSWTVLPLLIGIFPVLIRIALPYHFATDIIPLYQMLLMFSYSFGWAILGHALSTSPQTQGKPVFETQQSLAHPPTRSA